LVKANGTVEKEQDRDAVSNGLAEVAEFDSFAAAASARRLSL
jgi:hypothetical protein